ncbi:hypothetical protein EMIHUDRAFT_351105 [Emiliania huxleyi CCMP1516]|uniref:Uncharacterized protein n=2 Tax=Emiliania huxleyi TaxID=2903 RepID=A0A0D3I2D9_EMIH1|nr:hypothetical protein EMIHUDRAFT_351105 [Emiliania huxleyi CCMP1516]EOD05424.1 hypothetical protein EMIHUDRAFT_351105 [Emiliania huxleyi CCMP1516]|eukprot:XP_005757853.1 hypothetical protein EMIHUDRAFT_351105 [Emiliania huxleyi CCMP1516]
MGSAEPRRRSLRSSALSRTSAPTRREVPVVGHRALRLQRAGGWRGEGGQRRGWRHRLEVGS